MQNESDSWLGAGRFHRGVPAVGGAIGAFVGITGLAAGHVGALSETAGSTTVPPWLTFLTGGGIVAGSFLFTALLTDDEAIRTINQRGIRLPTPRTLRVIIGRMGQLVSVGVLLLVIAVGVVGPMHPTANLAILVVWAGWWAGYTASIYLVGNTWVVLNPWRAIAEIFPNQRRWSIPEWTGPWPSVLGLLALVFIEVVTPVAADPRLLAGLIVAYTVVTVGGAVAVGTETWFTRVDPIARVFRMYGAIAPIQRTDDGLELRLPTAALTDADTPPAGETVFVIALLWATTFDGFVSTPAWAAIVTPIVTVGIPALLVYGTAMMVGFFVFLSVYRLAASKAQDAAESYVTPTAIGKWLIPALLPIAAAYHLAHFLGYFVALAPALGTAFITPFSGHASGPIWEVPGWWAVLQLGIVLVGHLLAVWVAHALSLELFPGRLRAIRSQAPFVVAMIVYTVTSMWVIVQPTGAPPFV